MEEEKKAAKLEFKEGKLFVMVDSNKDGEAVMSLEIDLSEVADEVVSFFKKD